MVIHSISCLDNKYPSTKFKQITIIKHWIFDLLNHLKFTQAALEKNRVGPHSVYQRGSIEFVDKVGLGYQGDPSLLGWQGGGVWGCLEGLKEGAHCGVSG